MIKLTQSSPITRGVSALACLLAAAVAVGGVGTTAASAASSSCGYSASPVFAAWTDTSLYTPFQGSGFENGASGWSWGNKANVVSGANSGLAGSGSHAVNIPASGTAKSPWLCVDATTPSLRFMIRRVSGTGNLTVNGAVSGGDKHGTTVAVMSGTSTWRPSPIVVFPDEFLTSSTLKAQFLFVADPGSVYQIDDVYLDPFRCC